MRQIYVIAFFLMPFLVFSQLYIKPSNNQDSYIYVQGEVLYVEKEIDLKINPSEDLKASIYLRNEAQLLQGNASVQNTGNGLLSVFQEGNATAYTYNYWSLPVQVFSNSPLLNDVIYDPLSKTESSNVILSPHLNGTSKPLKVSSRWLHKLSGFGYSDWIHIGNNFKLLPGEGFTMKGVDGENLSVVIDGIPSNPGNQQRYDFRGKPNNGDIALDISEHQILLIGNPYPSAMNLNVFLEENLSTSGIAYFWDSEFIDSHYLTDYEGGYGAYSPAGGSNGYVPAAFSKYDSNGNALQVGHRGNHYARQFSPIGQGFIVEGIKDGKVIFKNDYRQYVTENRASSQFKSANPEPILEKDPTHLRLNIEFDDQFIRQLLILHHAAATNGVDHAMDAKNLMPLPSDAGWSIEDEEYLINVRPLDLYDHIPLSFYLSKEQEIIISLEEQNNIDADIYIYDAEKERYHNLLSEPFQVFLAEGSHPKKFFLTFLSAAEQADLGEEAPILESIALPVAINEYTIFQNNAFNRLEITAPLRKTPGKIELFDITGRKIREQQGQKEQSYYEFYTRDLSRGLYIVKITAEQGPVISKKVLISN